MNHIALYIIDLTHNAMLIIFRNIHGIYLTHSDINHFVHEKPQAMAGESQRN